MTRTLQRNQDILQKKHMLPTAQRIHLPAIDAASKLPAHVLCVYETNLEMTFEADPFSLGTFCYHELKMASVKERKLHYKHMEEIG